jgi:hypothetical protein
MTLQIRRLLLIRDTIHHEGGQPALKPVTRAAACAVIANPLAGRSQDDLSALLPLGEELGRLLVREAQGALPGPAVGYGKAAIVGANGEIEHAAALCHPRMGKPMREAIGGGKAIIPSNVKVAAPGAEIDVPLSDKDDVWNFDLIDTITVSVPGAPRPDEVVVIVALADGGRPRPRVQMGGMKVIG